MSTISVLRPVQVNTPRASSPAAELFTSFLTWFQQSRRVRAEQRASELRISEAAAVREYANRAAKFDPRFAADLMAAADRHEAVN